MTAYAKRYFKVLVEAVGDQVSPIKYLLCRSPITTIINLGLSRLPSDCIFDLWIYIHGVAGSTFSSLSTKKV